MRLNTPLPVLLALMGIFVLPTGVRGQITLNVPSTAYPTIQSAINAAVTGDTVLVAAGTYVENLVWQGYDISLIGAGAGLTVVDGNQSGSCLTINTPASRASVISGFTFTNGNGNTIFLYGPADHCGGGILIDDQMGITVSPVIVDCEIVANSAAVGAAICMRGAGPVHFERLVIDGNSQVGGNLAIAGVIVAELGSTAEFYDCRVQNHVASATSGFMIRSVNTSSLILDGCTIVGNSSQYTLLRTLNALGIEVRGCTIASNTILSPIAGQIGLLAGTTILFQDNLIYGNSGGAYLFAGGSNSGTVVQNCTIVNNTVAGPGNLPMAVFSEVPLLSIVNSIVRDNMVAGGGVLPSSAFSTTPPPYPPSVTNSNVQGYTGGVASIDSPIVFVDAATGDYRPVPGSPGIDGGTVPTVVPSRLVDIRGKNRVAGSMIDMGCFEVQSIGYSSAARGAVGVNANGPYDVLKINGSSGGAMRTVTVPIGSASVVSVDQPFYLANSANFVIFGVFGEAEFSSVLTVPYGIGKMMFAPLPMVPPIFQSQFFTFTDNFSPFLPQFVASTPTPWASPVGPGIPFPIVISFQGVMEDGPGLFHATNAVVYKVE